MLRLLWLGLLGVAACGAIRPDRGTGAADIPVTEGGFGGPAEGSLGNAANLGSNQSVILPGLRASGR